MDIFILILAFITIFLLGTVIFLLLKQKKTPIDGLTKSEFYFNTGKTIIILSLGGFHTAAITSKGRIFTWGFNNYFQLGDGTKTNKLVPKEITPQFNLDKNEVITTISLANQHSSALTSSGRLLMWGSNYYGQLGDGTTTYRLVPTEITSQFYLNIGETITSVSTSDGNSAALTSNGRIFIWGLNKSGQLGDGTPTDKLVPTDITSQFHLNPREIISTVTLKGSHSSVITSVGRVFTWGFNHNGQLGNGTKSNFDANPTPKDITSQFHLNMGETIKSVSLGSAHSSAITSKGRIFTWGENKCGQLGDGTLTDRLVPTEITSQFHLNIGETITSVSLGSDHSSAITSKGRIFTWGKNKSGQLGNGTKSYFDSNPTPEDITSQFHLNMGETITSVSLGSFHSSAITSKGRIFTWGHNEEGQLGNGTAINGYTPEEVLLSLI